MGGGFKQFCFSMFTPNLETETEAIFTCTFLGTKKALKSNPPKLNFEYGPMVQQHIMPPHVDLSSLRK